MSLMSRRAAALGVLLAAVLWLLRELRRRRDRLAALQLRGPSTPPTLPRPPSGRLLADDDGPRVTLRVSITKMKVRNLPEAPPPPWLLRAFVNPRPRLTLELRWADQSLDTGAGVAVPLEHCTSWPDSFAFEHEAAAAALSTQLLQVTALRDGAAVGRLALPVVALATGPTPNDHPLCEMGGTGAPTGARVAFRCRVAETREWRLRLTRLRLSLQSDALDAGTGGGSAALFALGYTFTSGSTGQSSRESNRRSPRTHLLPTSATGSGALELKWADAELPALTVDGAFWEVRHGALRIQVSWRNYESSAAAAAAAWRRTAGRRPPPAAGHGDHARPSVALMKRATGASADGIERRPSSEAGVERRPTPPDAAAAAAAVAAGEKAQAQAEAVKEEEVAEESGGAWMTATAWIVVEPLLAQAARARGGSLRKPKKVAEAARKIARDRWDDLLSDVRQPDGTIEVPPTPTERGRARTEPGSAPAAAPEAAAPAMAAPASAPSLSEAAVVLAERPYRREA